jgi:ribonuclease R
MYVEIEENKCEGMIRLSDVEDDFYELDAQNYRIIGRRNKRIISFGDEVWVEVKAANLNDRTIDLILVNKTDTEGSPDSSNLIEDQKRSSRSKGRKEQNSRPVVEAKENRKKKTKAKELVEWDTADEPVAIEQENLEIDKGLPEEKKREVKGRNLKDYYGFDE